jgi:hypothetical protein
MTVTLSCGGPCWSGGDGSDVKHSVWLSRAKPCSLIIKCTVIWVWVWVSIDMYQQQSAVCNAMHSSKLLCSLTFMTMTALPPSPTH